MREKNQRSALPGDSSRKEISGFGQRLRAIREHRNLRQAALAARLGLRPFAVSRYERGTSLPRITVLAALGRALQVSLDYLLLGEATGALRDLRLARHVKAINRLSPEAVAKLDGLLAAFLSGEQTGSTSP